MKINDIAEYIQSELLNKGFIVHRYNAYSTCSIYLKLDYGASNSIRISDHKGYGHLSYKYEVNQSFKIDGWRKDDKGFWRYKCQANKANIDKMINIILNAKQYKKCFNNYDKLMKQYKSDSKNSKGFWEKAWEVKL